MVAGDASTNYACFNFLYWIVLHKLHNWCNLCRTTQNKNMKTCIICIGVVWLVSPPAIGLSMMLPANEAICKLTPRYHA